RVLEDPPSRLEDRRQYEPQPRAPAEAGTDQPEQPVEREAVNDVREGVPVGDVLRVLRTRDDAVPHLDVAALADGYAAHREEDRRGDDHHGDRSPDVSGADVADARDHADRSGITQVLKRKSGHFPLV